jgi:hypothetical protein
MLKKSLVASTITAAIVAASFFASAGPALATTYSLPSDESLYIIDQAGRGVFETKGDGTSFKVDAEVGFTDIQSGAYDFTNKKMYVVDNTTLHLGVIDLLGGPFVDLGEIDANGATLSAAYGLVVKADGSARLMIYNDDDNVWKIYDISLTDGALTSGVTVNDESGNPFTDDDALYGYAIDPTTDSEYIVTGYGYETIIGYDPVTGDTTASLATFPNPNDVYGWDGKFDSNGVLWFMVADCCSFEGGGDVEAWKVGDSVAYIQSSPTAGEITPSGPLVVGFSTASLKPELPNTGTSLAEIGGLTALAIGGIFIGSTLLYLRRRVA